MTSPAHTAEFRASRHRPILGVVAGIVVVLILLSAAAAAAVVGALHKARPPQRSPDLVARQFFEAMHARDWAAAGACATPALAVQLTGLDTAMPDIWGTEAETKCTSSRGTLERDGWKLRHMNHATVTWQLKGRDSVVREVSVAMSGEAALQIREVRVDGAKVAGE